MNDFICMFFFYFSLEKKWIKSYLRLMWMLKLKRYLDFNYLFNEVLF